MSKYDYSRYLGDDFTFIGARVPTYLVDRAKKDSVQKRLSFNKRVVQLFEQEFGESEEAQKKEVSSEK